MKKMIKMKMTMGTKKVMIKTKIKVITATTGLKITSDDQGRNDSDKYYEKIAGLLYSNFTTTWLPVE
jgi:hypothetical protein